MAKLHTERLDCCCQACKENSGHFDTQYEYSDYISEPHTLDATPDNINVVSRQTQMHIINNHHQQPCCDK